MATLVKLSEETPIVPASPTTSTYNATESDQPKEKPAQRQKSKPGWCVKSITCHCSPVFLLYLCIGFFSLLQLAESGLVLYKRNQLAKSCTDVLNSTTATEQELDVEYGFYYMGCYGVITLLRIINFILLGRGGCHLAKELTTDPRLWKGFTLPRKLRCQLLASFSQVLLIFMLLAAMAYLILGILTEREYAKSLKCMHYSMTSFAISVITCVFNFITHFMYIIILTAMMAAATVMEQMLYANDEDEENGGGDQLLEEDPKNSNTVVLRTGKTPQQQYDEDGKRIRLINGVFQSWFLLALITLFIKIKMPEANQRLRPWIADLDNHATEIAVWCEVVHLIYQFLFMVILIDNAKKLEHVPKEYFRKLRDMYNTVREDIRNNFTPQLGHVDIPMNTIISIVFTLVGLIIFYQADSFLSVATA